MKGHGTKFGRKMEEAIAALLTHRNVEEAAQAINVTPKTLLRWMQIEEFRAAYLKARQEAVVSGYRADAAGYGCGWRDRPEADDRSAGASRSQAQGGRVCLRACHKRNPNGRLRGTFGGSRGRSSTHKVQWHETPWARLLMKLHGRGSAVNY
jgi:hypothetical protein